MKQTQKKTFLKEGSKEVIHFTTVQRRTDTLEQAKSHLNDTVQNYISDCNQAFNLYYAKDNPYSIILIHGVND